MNKNDSKIESLRRIIARNCKERLLQRIEIINKQNLKLESNQNNYLSQTESILNNCKDIFTNCSMNITETEILSPIKKLIDKPVIIPEDKPVIILEDKLVNKSLRDIKKYTDMRFFIKQGRVSSYISYFKPFFFKTFNLTNYSNKNTPCVFFGCYTDDDLASIYNHKSISVIVWAGNDSNYKKYRSAFKALMYTKRMKNVFHISISNYIFNDLNFFNIKSLKIPFCISDMNTFNPIHKGKCIYYYTNFCNPERYGANIFNKIYKELKDKYKFIITVCKQQMLRQKGMYSVKYPFLKEAKYYSNVYLAYKESFIGLRLTTHDGNANTVQELGMCGIKCFYNGDPLLKSAIPWKNSNDIIKRIEEESKTIGTKNVKLSQEVKDYLKPNNSWLDIRMYTTK